MILLVDTAPLVSPGGLRLAFEWPQALVKTCPPGSTVVALRSHRGPSFKKSSELKVVDTGFKSYSYRQIWKWANRDLPQFARLEKSDVVFSLNGILSRSLTSICPTLMTVNNMVPFTPEVLGQMPWLSKLRFKHILNRRVLLSSLKKASGVILHSKHAQNCISRYSGDIKEKSRVVLSGIPNHIKMFTGQEKVHPYYRKPYIFYLSPIRKYKNQLRVIQAFKLLVERNQNPPDLLLAGYPLDPEYLKRIRDEIRKLGLAEHVKYLGTLEEADVMNWIYYASINVFASLCETNSTIQAEILGLGAVMACSRIPPMPEVAGPAAEYFDPLSVTSMGDALQRILSTPERSGQLKKLARIRSSELSWEECGRTAWGLAREILE